MFVSEAPTHDPVRDRVSVSVHGLDSHVVDSAVNRL